MTWLEHAGRDVRHAARMIARMPGLATVVIVSLAIGIGVNAAIFSVVHAVLWRSLPYPDASRIVVIEADTRSLPTASPRSAIVCISCVRRFASWDGCSPSWGSPGSMPFCSTSAFRRDSSMPRSGAFVSPKEAPT